MIAKTADHVIRSGNPETARINTRQFGLRIIKWTDKRQPCRRHVGTALNVQSASLEWQRCVSVGENLTGRLNNVWWRSTTQPTIASWPICWPVPGFDNTTAATSLARSDSSRISCWICWLSATPAHAQTTKDADELRWHVFRWLPIILVVLDDNLLLKWTKLLLKKACKLQDNWICSSMILWRTAVDLKSSFRLSSCLQDVSYFQRNKLTL